MNAATGRCCNADSMISHASVALHRSTHLSNVHATFAQTCSWRKRAAKASAWASGRADRIAGQVAARLACTMISIAPCRQAGPGSGLLDMPHCLLANDDQGPRCQRPTDQTMAGELYAAQAGAMTGSVGTKSFSSSRAVSTRVTARLCRRALGLHPCRLSLTALSSCTQQSRRLQRHQACVSQRSDHWNRDHQVPCR